LDGPLAGRIALLEQYALSCQQVKLRCQGRAAAHCPYQPVGEALHDNHDHVQGLRGISLFNNPCQWVQAVRSRPAKTGQYRLRAPQCLFARDILDNGSQIGEFVFKLMSPSVQYIKNTAPGDFIGDAVP